MQHIITLGTSSWVNFHIFLTYLKLLIQRWWLNFHPTRIQKFPSLNTQGHLPQKSTMIVSSSTAMVLNSSWHGVDSFESTRCRKVLSQVVVPNGTSRLGVYALQILGLPSFLQCSHPHHVHPNTYNMRSGRRAGIARICSGVYCGWAMVHMTTFLNQF